MPRPRIYANDAERQAAYRARRNLGFSDADLLRWLHMAITDAANNGKALYLNPWDVLGDKPGDTLRNLERELRK